MRVALVDHSYHLRTASTAFFAPAVLANCQVDEWWDDSWQGGAAVDVAEIARRDYDLVVVFQVETAAAALAKIDGLDVVFIPMWDSCLGLPDEYWSALSGARIVSFSHALHGRVQRLGILSARFQYFPDPESFPEVTDFDSLRGFFWLRRREIRWERIQRLTSGAAFDSFHVHLAQDPGNETVLRIQGGPSLTTSTWFDTRAEYVEILEGCNVYFAPRLAEGIGSSFLEAMAMGMCVVAANAPTMNEYLTHGTTGLLWSPEDPRPIDFSQASAIGARARERAVTGHRNWLEDLDRLHEFVWTRRPAPLRASNGESGPRAEGEQLTRLQSAARTAFAVKAPLLAPGGPSQGGRRCLGLVMRDRASSPLVTVVTVTLNCAEELKRTLQSTLAQDYGNLEIIVVDGGSTDGTLDVIRAHESEIDLWTSAADRGPYDAMNSAADLANGRYCLFMNAGDRFVDSHAVSRALEGAPPTADFIFGHHIYFLIDATAELHKANEFENTWRWLRRGELSGLWLQGVPCHQATFTRTQLLREHRYDLRYKIAADHEFMYRQRLNGASFHNSDEIIAEYVSGGYSWNNQIRCFQEWLDIARRFGPAEAAERFFRPMIRSAIRAAHQGPPSTLPAPVEVGRLRKLARRATRRWHLVAQAVTEARRVVAHIRTTARRVAARVDTPRRERRRLIQLVQSSGLFSESWYRHRYPDVRRARVDPLDHYLRDGADELRDPSPFFNTAFYLETNPDVPASGLNPLIHYLRHGAAEGRAPTAWFARAVGLAEPQRTNGASARTLIDWLAKVPFDDLVREWPGPDRALLMDALLDEDVVSGPEGSHAGEP